MSTLEGASGRWQGLSARRGVAGRWLLAGGVALLLLAIGWGWWRQRLMAEQDKVWARIQQTGVLRVGLDASFPPFEVVNAAGEFAGYDVELARELARRLGIGQVQFVNIHFDGLYDALLDGKCDIILSALPYDRDLTQDVHYSLSYFNAGQLLLARKEEQTIRGPQGLKGKRVAVELGSEAHYVAREMSRKSGPWEMVTAYSAAEALHLLQERQADALIVDAVTGYTYARQHEDIRLVGDALTDEPYVLAVPFGSARLAREINAALAACIAEGYPQALGERWFR